jgi:hypothetical protein
MVSTDPRLINTAQEEVYPADPDARFWLHTHKTGGDWVRTIRTMGQWPNRFGIEVARINPMVHAYYPNLSRTIIDALNAYGVEVKVIQKRP